MTDTHVDMKYAVGAVATGCREPLCCRENQNKPNKQSIAAGPWGAYNHCDIPWNTVRNMLETLAGRHKVLYIHKTTRAKIVQNCSLHGFMWQHVKDTFLGNRFCTKLYWHIFDTNYIKIVASFFVKVQDKFCLFYQNRVWFSKLY